MNRETGRVDVIVMASGLSVRFGAENKLLAPFHGEPLALHALNLACATQGIHQVLCVWANPAVAALAEGLPLTLLYNPHPQRGQCESIRLGVAASQAEYYLFLPCDQPLLQPEDLHAILAARQPGKIVVPTHKGKTGSPALFSAAFREELLALAEHQHARTIKARHPKALLRTELQNQWALADIDTPKELSHLQTQYLKKF